MTNVSATAIREILATMGRYQVPAVHVLRHLTHVYWNMRYIGVDTHLIERIERAKMAGAEWLHMLIALEDALRTADEFDQGRRVAEFHACLEMIPDHLLGPDGKVVWVAVRPKKSFVPLVLKPTDVPPSP